MKKNPKELYKSYLYDGRGNKFPSRVVLEFTNSCNLFCRMCPRRYFSAKKGFLSHGLFKKVIDELSMHADVTLVPFFRGESLSHPNFVKMLNYIKEKGIKPVQLATNATLLDARMRKAILNSGINFISFSLDALDKDTYNKIRLGADFDKVVANIENFLDKKSALGEKIPQVQISMVETDLTAPCVDSFIARWIDKVDRVRIYREHSPGGKFGHLKNSGLSRIIKRKPCLKLISEIVICWNGDVAICNHDWQRRKFIGNIKDNTIAEIWNSGKYHALRKEDFDGRIKYGSVCAKCDHWKAYYSKDNIIGRLYIKGRNKVKKYGI